MPQELRLDEVSVRMRRGAPWLLDAVTVAFRPGTITTVTGANGTGKSTLLRVIAGLRRPTSGRVSGRPAHIGFCPERLPVQLRLSTDAYVHHLAAIHEHPEFGTEVESLLRRMNFIGDASAPMSSLSKGNVQKVLLATTLGLGASLLVLDEPWSGLDATARTALSALLREQAGDGRTVVLAEHPDAVDDRPFQQVVELRAGKLVPRGTQSVTSSGRAAIVLRPREHGDHSHRNLLPAGVGRITVADGLVHVACPGEQVDTLLSSALITGYSVVSVQRTADELTVDAAVDGS